MGVPSGMSLSLFFSPLTAVLSPTRLSYIVSRRSAAWYCVCGALRATAYGYTAHRALAPASSLTSSPRTSALITAEARSL